MRDHPCRVDSEDSVNWHSYFLVRIGILYRLVWGDFQKQLFFFTYVWSVSITSEERIFTSEERLDFFEAAYLELLWVSVNDFSFECMNKRVRVEEERSIRKTIFSLPDMVEVILGDGCLTNGPGTQVHYLVPILPYLTKEVCHTHLSPVIAYDR